MTQWYEIGCPSCDATNWINNGDPSDSIIEDFEGFVCHKCKRTVLLTDGELTVSEPDEQLYIQNGEASPL